VPVSLTDEQVAEGLDLIRQSAAEHTPDHEGECYACVSAWPCPASKRLGTALALQERLEAAAEIAADIDRVTNENYTAIAKATGCETWEYPGQVVRWVQEMAARLQAAEAQAFKLVGVERVLDTYIDPTKGAPHDRVFLLGQRAEAAEARIEWLTKAGVLLEARTQAAEAERDEARAKLEIPSGYIRADDHVADVNRATQQAWREAFEEAAKLRCVSCKAGIGLTPAPLGGEGKRWHQAAAWDFPAECTASDIRALAEVER
jgi:hypothetical protein